MAVTWSPSDKAAAVTLSNGNLTATASGGSTTYKNARGTDAKTTGKHYLEYQIDDLDNALSSKLGIALGSYPLAGTDPPTDVGSWYYRTASGAMRLNNVTVSGDQPALVVSGVLQVAIDCDTGSIWFGANGVWINAGDPATGANPNGTGYAFAGGVYPLFKCGGLNAGQSFVATARFGAASQTYAAPAGFAAWDAASTIIGSATYEWPLALAVATPYRPEWPLTLQLLRSIDVVGTWPLSLAVVVQAQPEWALSLAVALPTLQPAWPLALAVTGQAQPAWPLDLVVLDFSIMKSARAYAWSAYAVMNGVDVSARLVGQIEIDAEANSTAVATLTLRPPAGVFYPAEYIGREILLTYFFRGEGDAPPQGVPMFRGQVETVEVDPASYTVRLTCTDNRRRLLYGARGGLGGLLPDSLWSAAVFDAEADGYRQAEDRLSTLCADFDLSPNGAPNLTPWQSKATADWAFHQADCLDGSLSLELGRISDLVQYVDATLLYRFTRLRRRSAALQYTFAWGDLTQHSIAPPASSMIQDALEDTGWTLEHFQVFRPYPSFQSGGVYYQLDAVNGTWLMSARIGKRFAQSIEERFKLRVDCGAASDVKLSATLSGALASSFDGRAWEDAADAAPVLPLPGWAAESAADAINDDATGRAAAEMAIRTLLAMARRIIRDSHRRNRVTFSAPLNPMVDRTATVQLSAFGITAIGRVQRIRHALDMTSGRAVSTITLALSAASLVNGNDSLLDPPAASEIPPVSNDVRAAHYIALGNHVGGTADSPPYQESMQGYICNIPSEAIVSNMVTNWGTSSIGVYDSGPTTSLYGVSSIVNRTTYSGAVINPSFQPDKAYPWQFRVTPPAIEPAVRDNLSIDLEEAYQVVVPNDIFIITIP